MFDETCEIQNCSEWQGFAGDCQHSTGCGEDDSAFFSCFWSCLWSISWIVELLWRHNLFKLWLGSGLNLLILEPNVEDYLGKFRDDSKIHHSHTDQTPIQLTSLKNISQIAEDESLSHQLVMHKQREWLTQWRQIVRPLPLAPQLMYSAHIWLLTG